MSLSRSISRRQTSSVRISLNRTFGVLQNAFVAENMTFDDIAMSQHGYKSAKDNQVSTEQ
jgi:hypothetical protein